MYCRSLLKAFMKQTRTTLLLYPLILFFVLSCKDPQNKQNLLHHDHDLCKDAKIEFGFNTEDYHILPDTIRPNEFLADILLRHGISYSAIDKIAKNASDVYDVRNLRKHKTYALVYKDSCALPEYFVYRPSAYRYIMYSLQDSFKTIVVEHPVDIEVKMASGIIQSSLWNAMVDNDLPYSLIAQLEDALAWSIDFHHILKGDAFKVIYEQEFIDGQSVGIGKLLAAYFKNYNNAYYAIYFENEKHHGYFDEQGRSMKKAFLKAPVKYSRVSSGYNLRRRHPILKRVRPHLGTDYAAPYGTPIMAVADGVISKVGYTKGNGNYVKIKHDRTYSTQYLHMKRFAKNIKPGVHVKQEQIIGYVGSTGLATGPHVCFRFWKNGKQVDHRREKLPPPEPMPDEALPQFYKVRDDVMAKLQSIPLPELVHRERDLPKMEEDTTADKRSDI